MGEKAQKEKARKKAHRYLSGLPKARRAGCKDRWRATSCQSSGYCSRWAKYCKLTCQICDSKGLKKGKSHKTQKEKARKKQEKARKKAHRYLSGLPKARRAGCKDRWRATSCQSSGYCSRWAKYCKLTCQICDSKGLKKEKSH